MNTALENSLNFFKEGTSVQTDNFVFRLYYKFTTLILLTASVILITNQVFGDPIDCMGDGAMTRDGAFKQTIDNYCWVVKGTYTIPELFETQQVKIDQHVIHSGVGQYQPKYHSKRHNHYYRWTFLLLFIQGVLFSLPYNLWRSWEAGKVAGLALHLDSPIEQTLEKGRRKVRIALTVDSLERYDLNSHERYTYRFYFCEVLNILILLGCFFVTDSQLDYRFKSAGWELVKTWDAKEFEQMFPTLAKCDWSTYGPSGSIQGNDGLCILPLNTFNKFTFQFLWCWYAILGSVTIAWLIFRVVTIFSCSVRIQCLRFKVGAVHCPIHNRTSKGDCLNYICKTLPHSDWYVILQLCDNIDGIVAQELLEELCERFNISERTVKQYQSTPPDIIVDLKT